MSFVVRIGVSSDDIVQLMVANRLQFTYKHGPDGKVPTGFVTDGKHYKSTFRQKMQDDGAVYIDDYILKVIGSSIEYITV